MIQSNEPCHRCGSRGRRLCIAVIGKPKIRAGDPVEFLPNSGLELELIYKLLKNDSPMFMLVSSKLENIALRLLFGPKTPVPLLREADRKLPPTHQRTSARSY